MNRKNKKRMALGIAAGTGIVVPMGVALILFLMQDDASTRNNAGEFGSAPASTLANRHTPDAAGASIMLDTGATLMLAQDAGAESFATLGGGTGRDGAERVATQAGGSNGLAASRNKQTPATRPGRTKSGTSGSGFGSMVATVGSSGGGSRANSSTGTNGSGSAGTNGSAGADGGSGGAGVGGGSGPDAGNDGDTTNSPPNQTNASPDAGNPASTTPNAPAGTDPAKGTPQDTIDNPGGVPGTSEDDGTADALSTPPADAPDENSAPGGQSPVALEPLTPPAGVIDDSQVFSPTAFGPSTTQVVHTVPEPGALGLVFAALFGLGLARRARNLKQ